MMTDNSPMLDRNLYVVQLTSLRGIACLVVLIGHVIQVINYNYASGGRSVDRLSGLITGTFNAEGAVLVFFVLSGCVLSLSLRNVETFDGLTIFSFYLKRVFRLYPLLWLSLVLGPIAMILSTGLAKQGVLSDWLGANILSGLSLKNTVLSLSGLYTRYNGPMWSLRVELICSVLFPAIFLLVKHKRTRILTLIALTMIALLPVDHRYGLPFGLPFAVGALIPMLPYRPRRFDVPLVLIALIALIYDRLALGACSPPERIFDLIETAAAFIIVRDIFTAGQRYRFLLAPQVVTLGEISFSVYLLHLPVFLILFVGVSHFIGLHPLLDNPAISQVSMSLLTALVTIVISIFTYRLVELPMHNLGRGLAKRISQRNWLAVPPGIQKAEPPLA